MPRSKRSADFEPVAWVGHYPVHISTLVVALHVLTMIGTAIVVSLRQQGLLESLMFSNVAVWNQGYVWQLATHAFVNRPGIWFAIEMYLLFTFAREVERYIGRTAFTQLYLALLIVPAALLTPAAPWLHVSAAGSMHVHFGVFVAFAALYPTVALFGRIEVRWVVLVVFSVLALEAIMLAQWGRLIFLCLTTSTACVYVQFARGLLQMPSWRKAAPPPRKKRVAPRKRAAPAEPSTIDDVHRVIDPLLDKIATAGLESLTPRERQELERARAVLMKKSR
jgi:membrane associated rhomboid family serine protease